MANLIHYIFVWNNKLKVYSGLTPSELSDIASLDGSASDSG